MRNRRSTSRRRFLRAGLAVCSAASTWCPRSSVADDEIRSAAKDGDRTVARIAQVKVHPVTVNRVYKTRLAPAGGHGAGKKASCYFLLELTSEDGDRGLGEISDVEIAWNAPPAARIERFLESHLAGANAFDRRRLTGEITTAMPDPWHHEFRRMAATSVDMALADLVGRASGLPLNELLGGRFRATVPVSWVAFLRDTSLVEEEIREKREAGFGAFKLKAGENFADDCAHVEAARHAAGPNAHLRIDPSGSWEPNEAIENIRRLSALGVDAVETPIRHAARSLAKEHPEQINRDVDGVARALAAVRREVPAKIIEHVVDFDDAFAVALVRHRAVDYFNVAVSQAGSLERAMRLIHLAEAAGIGVLLGSTVELGPGTAAAVHVGVAGRGVNAASDLVGPGLLEDDVITKPLEYVEGSLRPSQAAGLGVELDPAKLARYRTPEPA